jgi:hypothetical protein
MIVRVTVPPAVHKIIAYWEEVEVRAELVVLVNVTSESVVMVFVPAIAASR